MTIATWLDDEPKLDWDDFEGTGQRTRAILRKLAADKLTLRQLVYGIESDPDLFAKCECHELLDYLVLYDALDRGLRIRLHFSTRNHLDRPHDHRFSFSALIVCGQYEHVWHEPDLAIDPNNLTLDDLQARFRTIERTDACYTLHHTLIHTTITTDDTVSLFLRGPAEKPQSIIIDSQTKRVWWRQGAVGEDEARRSAVTMGLPTYYQLRDKAERLGII
jgi:hypothetical protein